MAIRDRFRRAMHKNDSDSNISQTESNTTSGTNTSSEASSLHKQPTNASSTTPKLRFPWSSNESDKEKDARKQEKENKKKAAAKKKKGPVHPRDRELTAANLRNQEMLNGFDFSFGSSPNRLSQLVPVGPYDIGVSPCCTRPASINGDDEAPDVSPVDEITELQTRS